MAQEQKRDQTVRLPNPSAQPFVSALKTARFFAVLFFWVTMVCVLAHAATFFLMEWFGVYDAPAAEARAPAGAASETVRGRAGWFGLYDAPPAGAASETVRGRAGWFGLYDAPPAGAASETVRGRAGWFGLLESAALAAEPGELFPNVEPSQRSRKPAPAKPVSEESSAGAAPPPPAPVRGGVVAGGAGEAAGKPAPLTAEQRRRRALYYHNLTAGLLHPARIIGVLSAMLLTVTLFIYLQIALLGRLAGIRQLTRALFVMLLFLWTVLPWESIFEGFRTSALFDFETLLEAHAARAGALAQDWVAQVAYYGRFMVMPVAAVLLLAWSGIQFASGYNRSVLANE